MHAALDQGEIPKKINRIPKSNFNRVLKSLFISFSPTENIITGMLNKKITKLPIEKFFVFNNIIDAEIDPKQDKINDPMINPINKIIISFIGRLNKSPAIGIVIKKGTCTNRKCDNIFKKTINS